MMLLKTVEKEREQLQKAFNQKNIDNTCRCSLKSSLAF